MTMYYCHLLAVCSKVLSCEIHLAVSPAVDLTVPPDNYTDWSRVNIAASQYPPDLPPIIIRRLRNMTAIDSTGLQALEKLAHLVHASDR
jgi:hypothetical protein